MDNDNKGNPTRNNTSMPYNQPHHGNRLFPAQIPRYGNNLMKNQFEYPIGNIPMQVNHYGLGKQSKEWTDIVLQNKHSTHEFYNLLQGRFQNFNVFLLEYKMITMLTGVLAITPENCKNYQNAKTEMSNAIFTYLDINKDTIFETFQDPIHYIEAY